MFAERPMEAEELALRGRWRNIAISPSRGVPIGCRFSLAVSAVSSFVPV
jgi:hypothetical protein